MQANGPDRVKMATHLGSSMVAMFGAGKAVSVLGDVGRVARAGLFGPKSTTFESKLLESLRAQLMRKVEHPGLKKLVRVHYRENARVASGSTADALRHEIKTGEMLSPSGHMQKVLEGRDKLTRLIKSGSLSQSDLDIAKWVRQDLIDALSEDRVHSHTMKNQGM